MKGRTLFLIVTILFVGVFIGFSQTITTTGSNRVIFENDNSEAAKAFVTKIEKIGRVYDVIQIPEGYVSVSKPTDGSALIIRKTSTSGQRIWEKKFTLFGAFPVGIAQIADGYVFVGWYREQGNYYYAPDVLFFIAIKNDGTVNWTKKFDKGSDLDFTELKVSDGRDGGFMVNGRKVLVNFSSRGDILWSKRLKNLDIADSLPVSDGFILTANRNRILKVNDSGNIVWKKALEIKGVQLRFLGSGFDNGFVVGGTLESSSLLIALDANGNVKWNEKFSDFLISSSPTPMPDGGYALMGKTSGGLKSLLRINAKRDVVFQTIFDFPGTVDSIFSANNEGYVIYGSAPHLKQANDVLFLSLNSKGIVPGCNFFHQQMANNVTSPAITSKNIEVTFGPFSLPALGALGIGVADSESSTSNACP